MSTIKQEEVYAYIENLRKEGSINMLGAGTLIAEHFNITPIEGKNWLAEWIKSKTVSVPVMGVSTDAGSGDV